MELELFEAYGMIDYRYIIATPQMMKEVAIA